MANFRLNLRRIDELEATPLDGTVGSRTPFFSPDGEWIGFWADGAMQKVSVRGGPPIRICSASELTHGASWPEDGTILFGQASSGIWRVSDQGGEPQILVETNDSETAYGPLLLPGGKAVLYSLADTYNWDQASVMALSLDSGESTVILRGGSDARYLPTGHLVYAKGHTLLAVPFDPNALRLQPGGKRLAVVISNPPERDVWILEIDRGLLRRLTTGGAGYPVWSPEGEWIAFQSMDPPGLARRRSDFSGSTELILHSQRPVPPVPYDFSPDGQWLIYGNRSVAETETSLWAVHLDRPDEPRRLLENTTNPRQASLSPGGRFLAYVSDDSGPQRVFVTDFPDFRRRWQVSTAAARHPVSSADGKELFYRDAVSGIMGVRVQLTEPEFITTSPELIIDTFRVDGPERHHDVTPDGHFVILRDVNTQSDGSISTSSSTGMKSSNVSRRRKAGRPHGSSGDGVDVAFG